MTGVSAAPKVVVAGSDFGRTYLEAVARAGGRLRLAGLLGRGSERTVACARRYDVPCWTDAMCVPEDTDLVCVVVGEQWDGRRLAERLLTRGIAVLHEHPVRADDIAGLLRLAARSGATYALQCHYGELPVMRRFLAATTALRALDGPEHLELTTSRLMLTAALDSAAKVAGALRPLTVLRTSGEAGQRWIEARLGELPVTLQVQNTYQPLAPDNGPRVELAVTVQYPSGVLTVVSPQGPLLWTPRLHRPQGYRNAVTIGSVPDPELEVPAWLDLTGQSPPSRRRQIGDQWPTAVLAGIEGALARRTDRVASARVAQRWLGIARLVDQVVEQLGPPELTVEVAPKSLAATELLSAALATPKDRGHG
ncbi:Gfo/Idh/MocA family oxidoreductase [Kribbella sp. NPDC050820]|uniref:Gfo/Idh/MocA family oxidoreductase n=1 Tax=Kribbella sp. NPDC050820 TaxID=3155408 RepID=UPI0034003791